MSVQRRPPDRVDDLALLPAVRLTARCRHCARALIRPRISISSGCTWRMTPACSSARMPRAASARLIERPRSAARSAGRAGDRTGDTPKPRRASRTASRRARHAGADDVDGLPREAAHVSRRLQRPLQFLAEAEHILEAVVERNRRSADDIRLAPVARPRPFAVSQRNTLPRGPAPTTRERQLATARRRITRRDELNRAARAGRAGTPDSP